MILLIDNYDSFTFNLYQLLGSIEQDICVKRNNKITIAEIKKLAPSHIILSPGPGYPKDAGICEDVIKKFAGKIPLLGVCLGHQAIGEVFGGQVVPAPHLVHGKASEILIKKTDCILQGLHDKFIGARYHSLIVDKATFPDSLVSLAETEAGEVMALRHKDYAVYGLQFHPESIMTPEGLKILENFVKIGAESNDNNAKH